VHGPIAIAVGGDVLHLELPADLGDPREGEHELGAPGYGRRTAAERRYRRGDEPLSRWDAQFWPQPQQPTPADDSQPLPPTEPVTERFTIGFDVRSGINRSLPMSLPTIGRYSGAMSNVTEFLSRIEEGDPAAAGELLPLVYHELRKLAAAKMAQEKPGQTLQATALVHEAYLRLVDQAAQPGWDSRGHFFAAAAESMRRILVENARRKKRIKHGGELDRISIDDVPLAAPEIHEDLLTLDAALSHLESIDAQAAELVQLRYFAGFSNADAAKMLGISPRTADRVWAFARAWLHQEISGEQNSGLGADAQKK
jgi:RNA polymerase sigma factor (TIGR02999 family)